MDTSVAHHAPWRPRALARVASGSGSGEPRFWGLKVFLRFFFFFNDTFLWFSRFLLVFDTCSKFFFGFWSFFPGFSLIFGSFLEVFRVYGGFLRTFNGFPCFLHYF